MKVHYDMFTAVVKRIAAACLSAAIIGLVGCDSTTGIDGGGDVTLEGRVSDDAGFGKAAAASVEGAVVTAANVSADGSLNQLPGEATTDAEGQFSLDVDDATHEIVVDARKAGFESSALVFTNGRSSVTTMPLTAESHGEADVFVEARRQDDADDVTMADVAAYVSSQIAADIRSGTRSASEVAASITAGKAAQMEFVRSESGDDEAADAQQNENEAFFQLQVDLAASADAEADSEAVSQFEHALIDAYTDAGVEIQTQARARHAARAALINLGRATFEMEKQAELFASMAAAQAVEASFDAAGASGARLDALAQARETLVAELRAATAAGAVADAQANYRDAVEAELAAEANVEPGVLSTAAAATSAAKTALNVALSAAGSASAVATAYAEFFAQAEASVLSSLEGATSNASLGAEVLTLLSAS